MAIPLENSRLPVIGAFPADRGPFPRTGRLSYFRSGLCADRRWSRRRDRSFIHPHLQDLIFCFAIRAGIRSFQRHLLYRNADRSLFRHCRDAENKGRQPMTP